MDYGTGAIFGCPAHDQRDLDFARRYGLPVLPVVLPPDADPATFADRAPRPMSATGRLFHSRFLDGLEVEAAQAPGHRGAGARSARGRGETTWRLRDWGVSRQRYWGCPIPVIHCAACGVVPVPREQLPVELPEDVDFSRPGNPLDRHPTWSHVDCPRCGGPARRETDTFDTFVESSWYFARFADAQAEDRPFAKEAADYWLPVDQYIGGVEHASCTCSTPASTRGRWRECGYLDLAEPFAGLFTQGMITHLTFRDAAGNWLEPGEVARDEARRLGRRRRPSAGGRRPRREDEQVQAQHDRSRRRSSTATAPTPRACSCCPTARPTATWNGPMPASTVPGAI